MIINNRFNYKPYNQMKPKHNIGFQAKIIDTHAHVGQWTHGDYFQKSDLLNLINKPITINVNGKTQEDTVEHVIVSNLNCIEKKTDGTPLKNEIDGNLEILKMSKESPIIKPMAVCQPKFENNADKIEKILQENPGSFVGLKFHPQWHNFPPTDAKYDPYMRVAKKYNLPCLFHCGEKHSPDSNPKSIYELAKRHPDVPVILGHMGTGGTEHHEEAINVLKESIEKGDAKLYADVSWVNCNEPHKEYIIKAINTLKDTSKGDKTDRLLFGTDAPVGQFGSLKGDFRKIDGFYERTVSEVKTSIARAFGDKAETITQNLFYNNADELFFKKNWAKKAGQHVIQTVETVVKKKI